MIYLLSLVTVTLVQYSVAPSFRLMGQKDSADIRPERTLERVRRTIIRHM